MADTVTSVAAASGGACCLGYITSYAVGREDVNSMYQVLFAYFAGRYENESGIAATQKVGQEVIEGNGFDYQIKGQKSVWIYRKTRRPNRLTPYCCAF